MGVLRVVLAVAFVLVARVAGAGELEDAAAGWYTTDDGASRLLVWSGRGGLRLIDPVTLDSDWLKPGEGGAFAWCDGIKPRDARVTFPRDNGAVTGFRWSKDGATGEGRREPQGPYRVETLTCANGDISIAGNLFIPNGTGPHAAMVFIQGSGDNDRDNGWFLRFADFFVRKGVAAFIPDKRGCGASTGDWHTATLDDYARDSLAAAAALRTRADIGAVGVFGGSQGGVIAPIAGAMDPSLAFVIDISGNTVTLGEQVRHEVTQDLRNDGAGDDVVAAAMELFDRSQRHIRTGEGWDAYVTRVKELRKSDMKQASFGFITVKDNWYWTWWRGVIDVDPMDSWARLTMPGLILYGAEDEHDNVPVALSVARVEKELPPGKDITVRVFDGLGHGLWGADYRIREDVLATLWDWLSARL